MALLDLIPCGPSVIRQVVAAIQIRGAIDEASKVVFGFANARRAMIDMKIEDDAGPVFASPGQHTLIVFFNEANRSVDDVHA
jgi:hypothetical protein